MNESPKPIVQFQNVKKYFPLGSRFHRKYLHAVNDVSFDLAEKEILAVVGESGCGKTTMARMMTKLYEPTAGNILIYGRNITGHLSHTELRQFRSKIQMIYQDPFSSLNPAHNVGAIVGRAIGLYEPGISREKLRERVTELFETVGLTPASDFMGKHPNQLSGGQRQRIVIARALAVNPSIIVADEPTSMLDVSIGIDIMNLMLGLRDQKNLSFVYITHNLASARYMADKIIVMYAGTCVESGNMDDIVRSPFHPYTVLLLSSSPEPFREKQLTISAREDLPDLTSDHPRCLFCSRCPLATEECRTKEPPVMTFGNRQVKCFYYRDRAALTDSLIDETIYSSTGK